MILNLWNEMIFAHHMQNLAQFTVIVPISSLSRYMSHFVFIIVAFFHSNFQLSLYCHLHTNPQAYFCYSCESSSCLLLEI